MRGRIAMCGAAAVMMAGTLLFPAPSSAKGFLGAPMHHGGAFGFHFHRHGNGFLTRRAHGFRHRHDPYAYGYGYWPLGYGYGDTAPQEGAVPVTYPLYVGPRCEHSVEIVTVPAEMGGERKIRITRC